MNRRLPALLACLIAVALAAPAVAQDKIRLRMTTIVPEGTYLFTAFSKRFVENVQRQTAGRVEVTAYPPGVLAPPFEVYKAVEDGRADMGHAPPALIYQRDPTMALFTSFPGGLGIEATMHWLYQGDGLKLLAAHHRERLGLHPLVAGIATTEIFAHAHKPLRTAEDLKGLKFRTLGMWADLLRGFGAEPLATPTAEVATALERKVIDAAKMAGPADNLQMGLHKLAKYVMVPGAHLPGGYFTVFLKAEAWDRLPAEIRQQIETAARITSFDSYLEKGKLDVDAMAEMRRGPNEIIALDPRFIQQIKEAGRAWARAKAAEEKAKGNPWTERVAESVFAFQDKWEANRDYRM
jgi:TRAP-type mannitol/chloroaromatic compound transport system substrate-binding protein